jgi:3-hydroxybutyryl-CoA dehydrogenase
MKPPFQHIAIIGEGKMGTNLLYYLLDMNYRLTWVCSEQADTDKIERSFAKRLIRSYEAGILDEDRFRAIQERVNITKTISGLNDVDLVIEAISEDPEAKKKLFIDLDNVVPEDTVIVSNSSSINPSLLVPSEKRQARFAGLHFFYPVSLKNIVEIIRMKSTSKETMTSLIQFLNEIGRDPIILDEKNSFILNRIFLDLQYEAFQIVREGKATIPQIDALVKETLVPVGIFEFFDSVGLDVMLSSLISYSTQDEEGQRFSGLIESLRDHTRSGRLGMKTRIGYYPCEGEEILMSEAEKQQLTERLRVSFHEGFHRFQRSSGIPAQKLKSALDEYFGTEIPPIQ